VVSDVDGGFRGLLTRSDLMAGLARAGRDAPVAAFAKTEIPVVEASSPLVAAMARLREGHGPCLQVVEGDQTVGLLTLENVGEFLMVRSALAERPTARPAPTRGLVQQKLSGI
jgi:CBS domain-containing protein